MKKPTNKPDFSRIKVLVDAGHITTFESLFQDITKKSVYKSLGMINRTWERRLANPRSFTVDEIERLAELFNIPSTFILTLILQIPRVKKKRSAGK